MSLFGLVLAVGTAGMTMGVDLAGSEWRPSFMSAIGAACRDRHAGRVRARRQDHRQWRLQPVLRRLSVSGTHIKIGPLASTRKGCPGLLKLETTFFATLQAATSFEQTDTTLILFDAAGTKLAQFVRAEDEMSRWTAARPLQI